METVLASAIAVAGTLLGAALTLHFQRRTAQHAELTAKAEQRRSDRLEAYSAFATALVDYRRGQYDRWHRHAEDSTARHEVRSASYDRRSTAQHAIFRIHLLTDQAELTALADRAMLLHEQIHDAADLEDLKARGRAAKAAQQEFIAAAAQHTR